MMENREKIELAAETAIQKTYTTSELFVSVIRDCIATPDKKFQEHGLLSIPDRWTIRECELAMSLIDQDAIDYANRELIGRLHALYLQDPAKKWSTAELAVELEDMSSEAKLLLTYFLPSLIIPERNAEIDVRYGISSNMPPERIMKKTLKNMFDDEKVRERSEYIFIEWETEKRLRHLFGVQDGSEI